MFLFLAAIIKHGKNLFSGHIVSLIGKTIIAWFFFNKYLVVKFKLMIKKPSGHNILQRLFKLVENVCAAS